MTVPTRMRRLPLDHAGRPVPFFVQFFDGKPDHRVVNAQHFREAIRLRLCFVCGQPLGARGTFPAGPMCTINRVSAEPPSHLDCMTFSVTACPFLSTPQMRRRTTGLPEDKHVGGEMIERNPGVTLLWTTKRWKVESDGQGGVVVRFGEPEHVTAWALGRPATPEELADSITSGLPLLRAAADQDGPQAHRELDRDIEQAQTLLTRHGLLTEVLA